MFKVLSDRVFFGRTDNEALQFHLYKGKFFWEWVFLECTDEWGSLEKEMFLIHDNNFGLQLAWTARVEKSYGLSFFERDGWFHPNSGSSLVLSLWKLV